MTNVPLKEQTKESLIAYIQSLETTCTAQDAAAQKAQKFLLTFELTEKRLRNTIEELLARSVDSRADFENVVAPKLAEALDLKKEDAEKQIEALLTLFEASNLFCPDGWILLTGNSKLVGYFKNKLRACREAGVK